LYNDLLCYARGSPVFRTLGRAESERRVPRHAQSHIKPGGAGG